MTRKPGTRKPGTRRPGDGIFYPVGSRSSAASKFVAVFELLLRMGRGLRQFSHVAEVDLDTDHQLEAYWPRTRRSPIDPHRPREVWRLRGESPAQTAAGLRWCYLHLGERYNIVGLLFGWLRIRFHERYCSQFLRASKAAAGHRMPASKRGYFSPDQLYDYYTRHGFLVEEHL